MFISPDIGETGKFIYALVTYILFCVVYTALNIPYSTMMCNMTDNEGERLSFNMFKTIGSNGSAFVATGLTLGLVSAIGRGNQGIGFTGTLCFTSLIIRNQGTMYYAKYYLENEAAATPLMSIATLLGIPLVLVTPVIAKKIGTKRCVFIDAVIQAVTFSTESP